VKKNKIIELLEAADWKDIILKLTHYALWQVRKYTWRTQANDQLPGGKTPEDIACEAIEKVWNGTRDWDPDRYPNLLKHLTWIVKSDIGHLYSSLEHRKTINLARQNQDDNSGIDLNRIPADSHSQIHGHIYTPEEKIDMKEKKKKYNKLKSKLYDIVKGDEDLEMLLICFEEGIYKSKKISKETGWEISKVYNIKRKLQRRALKLKEIFHGGDKYEEQ